MPDWDSAIRARLKTLKLDGAREAEVIEELAAPLDDRYRELLAAGMDREQAVRVALEELDSHESAHRKAQEARVRRRQSEREEERTSWKASGTTSGLRFE